MKVVIQRSKKSYVYVKEKLISSIDFGLVIFLGIEKKDTEEDLNYLIKKIPKLRIFNDINGKLNKSLIDVKGSILLISQFTLCSNLENGCRPSFISAASPDFAKKFYNKMIKLFKNLNIDIKTGKFQTDMNIFINNDGPVTILIDTKKDK